MFVYIVCFVFKNENKQWHFDNNYERGQIIFDVSKFHVNGTLFGVGFKVMLCLNALVWRVRAYSCQRRPLASKIWQLSRADWWRLTDISGANQRPRQWRTRWTSRSRLRSRTRSRRSLMMDRRSIRRMLFSYFFPIRQLLMFLLNLTFCLLFM